MPYTPPSHRSPASSVSTSPDVSRRGSFQHGARPSLPHSASYLNKHRRTPSATSITSEEVSRANEVTNSQKVAASLGPALRQSPPPVTETRTIPNGAVISPPESAASGSDDDEPLGMAGDKEKNIKTLRLAVGKIHQGSSGSPENTAAPSVVADIPLTPLRSAMKTSFSTSALSDMAPRGHSRSATEPIVSLSADNSVMGSSESDEDLKYKPQMVRKKSGELVRPALRSANRRRPLSMPGTPVFSKAVHFDSHLEHVRHFLQVDRPLAVSAGSSPVEAYDSDAEYPFPGADKSVKSRSPPFEWELTTTNFPRDNSPIRRSLPARVEKVWLSKDQNTMQGSVAVANLSFHKSVVCRFTLDDWKTTSEVAAEYTQAILPKDTAAGYDRFTFSIQLADTANLECKTLYFCVRYSVDGQEHWDSNNGLNFQVDFQKKHLPQKGKNNFHGASGRPAHSLPRSNRRHSNAMPRALSFPATFDEFGDESTFKMDQPIHEFLGESESTGLRLRTKSLNNLASDNLVKTLTSPSGAAFSNRYDFGASLTAAVRGNKDVGSKDKDALYMKGNVRADSPVSATAKTTTTITTTHTTVTPAAGTTLASSSYEELVNKYCFFGTKSVTPATDAAFKPASFATASVTAVGAAPAGNALQNLTTARAQSIKDVVQATLARSISPVQASSHASTPRSGRSPSPSVPAPQALSDGFSWPRESHAPAIRG